MSEVKKLYTCDDHKIEMIDMATGTREDGEKISIEIPQKAPHKKCGICKNMGRDYKVKHGIEIISEGMPGFISPGMNADGKQS